MTCAELIREAYRQKNQREKLKKKKKVERERENVLKYPHSFFFSLSLSFIVWVHTGMLCFHFFFKLFYFILFFYPAILNVIYCFCFYLFFDGLEKRLEKFLVHFV